MISPSEHYEQLLAYISTHMPRPFTQDDMDGGVVFTGGSPGEVIVRLTQASVIVEEFAVRRDRLGNAALKPRRIGAVRWRRLPESDLMAVVGRLIKGAREMRLARYRSCQVCARVKPPELMASATRCRACSEVRAAVVH
jgi:hypothetical protein